MDALHRQFSRHVQTLMQDRGMSINALADAAGVGRGRLWESCGARSLPPYERLESWRKDWVCRCGNSLSPGVTSEAPGAARAGVPGGAVR